MENKYTTHAKQVLGMQKRKRGLQRESECVSDIML